MTDVIRLQKSVFVPQLKEIGFLRRELCYASTVGLLAVVIRLSMPKKYLLRPRNIFPDIGDH